MNPELLHVFPAGNPVSMPSTETFTPEIPEFTSISPSYNEHATEPLVSVSGSFPPPSPPSPLRTSLRRPHSPDLMPEKVRAISGPEQKEIDEERERRQLAERQSLLRAQEVVQLQEELQTLVHDNERLRQLEAQFKHEKEQNRANGKKDEATQVASLLQERDDSLQMIQVLNKKVEELNRLREMSEESDVTIALQQDQIRIIEEARDNAISQWQSIRQSSSELYEQARCAAQELQQHQEHIKNLEAKHSLVVKENAERKAALHEEHRKTVEKLEKERDQAVKEKIERETEIHALRRRQRSSPASSSSPRSTPTETPSSTSPPPNSTASPSTSSSLPSTPKPAPSSPPVDNPMDGDREDEGVFNDPSEASTTSTPSGGSPSNSSPPSSGIPPNPSPSDGSPSPSSSGIPPKPPSSSNCFTFTAASLEEVIQNAIRNYHSTTSQNMPPPPPQGTPAGPKQKRVPKPGTPTHSQAVKKDEFASMSKERERDWRRLMRDVFLAKTGMAGVNSFQDYCPVHDATAEGYAKGTCLGPEGDKKYTLFFGEGWQKSKWNRQFIANIIPDIKSKQPEYRILGECLSSLTIEGCLWDYIKQAQGSWKRDKPRVHHSGERFESRQEASNRAKQQEQDRSFQNRAHNRKTTKYKDRCKGVKALLKDTTLSSLQRKKWELLKDILDNLSNEAMSSEDTDYEDRDLPLVTAIPYYRRRIIGDLFEELDTAWKVLQRRQAHASGKRAAVKTGRIRRRGQMRSTRTIARSLAKVCYHRKFLQLLDPISLDALQVKNIELPSFDQAIFREDSDTEPSSDS